MDSTHLTVKSEEIETLPRSIAKTISYRLFIIILDFLSIYWLSGKAQVAIGFTIISNIYTTIGYFLHERIWNKIKWGKAK
ncbi:MAG: DUF2061 domain-containing protein [Bacteroidetes bacterium]|jgi:adenylylsulfate kinase|nr:DUF2061 domain-containing protein [Bacteroidota bacterium]